MERAVDSQNRSETKRRPLNILNTIRLKCPYCGNSSLLKAGSILEFEKGCQPCDYRYEREIGYFSGASWMMTYTVAAVSAMLAGGLMIWKYSDQSDLVIAGVPAAFGGLMAVVFIPFGRAFWMHIDHLLHPLTPADTYNAEPK